MGCGGHWAPESCIPASVCSTWCGAHRVKSPRGPGTCPSRRSEHFCPITHISHLEDRDGQLPLKYNLNFQKKIQNLVKQEFFIPMKRSLVTASAFVPPWWPEVLSLSSSGIRMWRLGSPSSSELSGSGSDLATQFRSRLYRLSCVTSQGLFCSWVYWIPRDQVLETQQGRV